MVKIILDDYGAQVEIENNGKKEYKFLSFPKFQQTILQKYNFDSGILPEGAIAFSRNGYGEQVAIIEKQQIRIVKYEIRKEKEEPKIEEYKIPLPSLVWIFRLDISKKLENAYVYGLKDYIVMPNMMLYHAPFSNVGQDGGICWGDGHSIIDKPFRTLAGLVSLTKFFFAQPFNSDLDIGLENPENKEHTLEFFRKYNNKTEFPLNILKPYKKFNEVWNAGGE